MHHLAHPQLPKPLLFMILLRSGFWNKSQRGKMSCITRDISHREGVEAKGLGAQHPIFPLSWVDPVVMKAARTNDNENQLKTTKFRFNGNF